MIYHRILEGADLPGTPYWSERKFGGISGTRYRRRVIRRNFKTKCVFFFTKMIFRANMLFRKMAGTARRGNSERASVARSFLWGSIGRQELPDISEDPADERYGRLNSFFRINL